MSAKKDCSGKVLRAPSASVQGFLPLLCVPVIGAWGTALAHEAAPSAHHLDAVTIEGHYDNAVGTSDAASQGRVTARLIENRPTLRPAEVLEFVPGVIVTQHSGGGKANQYFLRGFNLDHGTDFATYIDGMPANMPTHAHGHGYTDLNWLIPELVGRIDYRKGPYYAEEGDFASAGSARLRLVDRLDYGTAEVTIGQDGHRRGLLMNSHALGAGTLLYALETSRSDGPWDNPEDFRRINGVLRYTLGEGADRTSVTAMAYTARWDSTDQIPLRAVQSGLIGRYGTVDPTDGGKTWNDVSDRLDNEDQFHLNAIAAVKDAGLFIVGEQGSMFRSADWGQTWERVTGPYEGSLFGAQGTTSPNTLLVYGLRGNLFRSVDFGNTWQALQLRSDAGVLEFGLAGSSLLKDGSVVIVGHGGSVLKSTDAGRSFSVVNRSDRASLAGVTDDAAGNLILVGQGGALLATENGATPGQQQ